MFVLKTILSLFFGFMKFSPSPSNINYFWNFGSLVFLVLMIQIVSGIFISLHYSSNMESAFLSTVHISREVNFGWLTRMIHINGASMFFMMIFIHIIKAIINNSWKLMYVWITGIFILLFSMMVAFMGYVLPWGQMSFWAAMVITNLLSVIPMIGPSLVEWVWGGFSVSYPTLIRFFSFHFLFPMLILLLVILHILFLHLKGSSNNLNIPLDIDKISFDPFFSIKDILGFFFFFFLFMILMLVNPFYSVDSENFIEANSLVTPIHIKPEWYFLFAYAILRAVPNKMGGVIALLMSILLMLIKPFQQIFLKLKFNFFKKIINFLFFYSFLMLTYLGGKSVEYPFDTMSMFFSVFYFILVFLI